eukprot:g2202.t1
MSLAAKKAAVDDEEAATPFLPVDDNSVHPNNDNDHDGNGGEGSAVAIKDQEPYRFTILVTIAIFSGYAMLVVMQEPLGVAMGLSKSAEFHHACTLNYVGNLIFRLAHNFIFACFVPRTRVYISLGAMMLSAGILGFVVIGAGSHWLGWIYLCYFMGGVAIGTFESNLLSCITPLGPRTKVWAIIGMPVGFNIISIGGYAVLAALHKEHEHSPLMFLYMYVFFACLCGILLFSMYIPDIVIKGNGLNFQNVKESISLWREWIPSVRNNAIALACDMFSVSFFSGIMFYILNDKNYVPLWGILDGEKAKIGHDLFFVIYGVFTFAGDSLSRKFVYAIRPINPLWFLVLSLIGAVLCLCEVPALALPGVFLVFFANGSIYGASTRFIDSHVPKRYNLVALSFWLFIGDIGSVAGSNVWSLVKKSYCTAINPDGDLKYFCVPAQ